MDFAKVSAMLAPFGFLFTVTGGFLLTFSLVLFIGEHHRTGSAAMALSRAKGMALSGALLMSIPVIPSFAGWLASTVMRTISGEEAVTPKESSAPTTAPPSPAVTSPAEPSAAATPPDFSWVGPLLLVTAIIALAAVATTAFLKFGAPAIVKAQEQGRRARALKEEATEVYGQTMLASASYETDLGKQIDFPIMTDVTNPATSKYVKAMKNANLAIRTTPAKPSLAQAEHLMAEVQEFSVAFDAAERQAIRLKWSDFTVAEQTRLKDARTSLELIERGGLSDEARNAQYKRIVRLVEGLVTITTKSVQALSTKVPMLSLAKGEPAEEGQNVRR